jgi:hypothetical protein
MEDRGMADVVTSPEGEDIFLGDLMLGLPFLPLRQRQAFWLICVEGYTETAARDELLPNSHSSTPIQQAADSGLLRMVAAYDSKQAGIWPPPVPLPPIKSKRRSLLMAALHPFIRRGLETTRKEIQDEITSLQQALVQVDSLLSSTPTTKAAPTPAPEGKPSLEEAAKKLVAAG